MVHVQFIYSLCTVHLQWLVQFNLFAVDGDAYIPGQAYHMDLAFVSGLAKFNDLRITTEESVTMKQSIDWYISFLTMIDVASWQLWMHMIKNKDPPM